MTRRKLPVLLLAMVLVLLHLGTLSTRATADGNIVCSGPPAGHTASTYTYMLATDLYTYGTYYIETLDLAVGAPIVDFQQLVIGPLNSTARSLSAAYNPNVFPNANGGTGETEFRVLRTTWDTTIAGPHDYIDQYSAPPDNPGGGIPVPGVTVDLSSVQAALGIDWTVRRLAIDDTSTTFILYTNTNGAIAIVSYVSDILTAVINYFPSPAGPGYYNWTARDISASNGAQELAILWTNQDGSAAVWTLDDKDQVLTYLTSNIYPQLPGWHARSLSIGPGTPNVPDTGTVQMLWTHWNGNVAIWKLDQNLNPTNAVAYTFGAGGLNPGNAVEGAGWTGQDISVASTDNARFTWTNWDGTVDVTKLRGTDLSVVTDLATAVGAGPGAPDLPTPGLFNTWWPVISTFEANQ